jgi:hypothetical protein
MRRQAVIAVVAGVAVVLLGALAWWRPFLTEDRGFPAAIPQPAPLFSLPMIPVPAGQQTCFAPAVIDTHSRRAAFNVDTGGRPGEPLRLTINAPGYRFATPVKGGYPDHSTLIVPVPAPHRDLALRICIENAGRRTVSLWGADDRTRTPMITTRAGEPLNANPLFTFYEAEPGSLLGHLGVAFRRMAAFRPGVLGPWLFWPLALICVLGLVGGSLWALWRSIADEPYVAPLAEPATGLAAPPEARDGEVREVGPKVSRS